MTAPGSGGLDMDALVANAMHHIDTVTPHLDGPWSRADIGILCLTSGLSMIAGLVRRGALELPQLPRCDVEAHAEFAGELERLVEKMIDRVGSS